MGIAINFTTAEIGLDICCLMCWNKAINWTQNWDKGNYQVANVLEWAWK